MTDVQERFIELESRLAFQEDTLNQLNAVVTEQSGRIDQLHHQLRVLAEKYEDLRDHRATEGSASDEPPPPHY